MTETPKCIHNGAPCCRCMPNGPCTVPGPTEKTPEEALSAALHRAEPELRPLTLDEATASEDPVWLEAMGKVCIAQINLSPGESLAEYKTIGRGYAEYLYCGDYGILWRCWPRKPTPEQMAAAEWGE